MMTGYGQDVVPAGQVLGWSWPFPAPGVTTLLPPGSSGNQQLPNANLRVIPAAQPIQDITCEQWNALGSREAKIAHAYNYVARDPRLCGLGGCDQASVERLANQMDEYCYRQLDWRQQIQGVMRFIRFIPGDVITQNNLTCTQWLHLPAEQKRAVLRGHFAARTEGTPGGGSRGHYSNDQLDYYASLVSRFCMGQPQYGGLTPKAAFEHAKSIKSGGQADLSTASGASAVGTVIGGIAALAISFGITYAGAYYGARSATRRSNPRRRRAR